MTELNLEALRVAAEGARDRESAPTLNAYMKIMDKYQEVANPSTILQLIARLEASERDGAQLRADVFMFAGRLRNISKLHSDQLADLCKRNGYKPDFLRAAPPIKPQGEAS